MSSEVFADFRAFFEKATGQQPYPYQASLADARVLPDALAAPTGSGKTAALLLGWLWRRRFHADPVVRKATPRRLVYCLPMRVLVEQTAGCAHTYLQRLGVRDLHYHILLGGSADDGWVDDPDRDAILIGTQDMLLSRALNRGYAASRFRWPRMFGLLHTDALWVCDEVQLMGVGRSTAAQLQAFRQGASLLAPSGTVFVSATIDPVWLRTVDHPVADLKTLSVGSQDRRCGALAARLHAKKLLRRSPVDFGGAPKRVADFVLKKHVPKTLSLVVLNRVELAVDLSRALEKAGASVVLIHSRFRLRERMQALHRLLDRGPNEDLIAVSTQVVEAGIDVDAQTLFFQTAPWSSIVQRLGRCNRAGEYDQATAYWLKTPAKLAPPYAPEAIAFSEERLAEMGEGADVSPAALEKYPLEPVAAPRHVLRRRDLLDLFDTMPDISGLDVDVTRFVRDGDERDVHVFWREGSPQTGNEVPEADRAEICSIPISQLREYLQADSGRGAWFYDHLEERWRKTSPYDIRPGQTFLLDSSKGGYDPQTGFDPNSFDPVSVVDPSSGSSGRKPPASVGSDYETQAMEWVDLTDHTDRVMKEAKRLAGLAGPYGEALVMAARWHDAGKAHPAFQEFLRRGGAVPPYPDRLYAKSPTRTSRHLRPHFRHELVSALLILAHSKGSPGDLVAYLAASHHGKVRLSLRSLSGELPHPNGGRYALGVWEGDRIPAFDLGGQTQVAESELDLSVMDLGENGSERSWSDRVAQVMEQVGPFGLAYLEALLRAADARGSRAGEMDRNA